MLIYKAYFNFMFNFFLDDPTSGRYMETDQPVGLPDNQSVHCLTAPMGLQKRSRQ